ncbi:MAG: radical SAM protein [Candidatus Omnitrophota bacterium]
MINAKKNILDPLATNSGKRTWNDYSPCEVCLINPPWITKDEDIWHGIKATMPPLSLLSIAAYLEAKGRNVAIIDVHAEQLSIKELKERIARLKPKIVGITVMTATAIQANLIAQLTKKIDSSILIVMGGVHAEVLPEECLSNNSVDVVVCGDGEVTFYNLCTAVCNAAAYQELHGISYKIIKNNKIHFIHNPPADFIKDLSQLPMASYHLVPMHRYRPTIGAYRRLPAINMLMTRGCPGKCSFCNSAKTPLRSRDAAVVVDDIINLKNHYGINEIQFYDDTFTVQKKNVLKFCNLIKKRQVDITWSAFARVDCINEEMASAMKESGCHQIMFGIESGDEEVLSKMGKPIQLNRSKAAVDMVKKAGIEVRCTFVYGCEGETITSMQKTLTLALELDPDLAIFNIATPYPGTQLFNWAKMNNYLLTEDWTKYELGRPVIKLPTVSPEDLVKFYKKSFKIFYRRPKVFIRRIKKASSITHWRDMITASAFIMFRYKSGALHTHKQEWIIHKKEHFFDIPFDNA